jgi:hypothetical protein
MRPGRLERSVMHVVGGTVTHIVATVWVGGVIHDLTHERGPHGAIAVTHDRDWIRIDRGVAHVEKKLWRYPAVRRSVDQLV